MILLDQPSTIWPEVLLNISCNVAAAVIFLLLLYFVLKPRIRITKFICENTGYRIEIINRSLFMAYDIKAQLWSCVQTPSDTPGLFDNNYKAITLVAPDIVEIAYRPSWFRKHHLSNAARFLTNTDLNATLSDKNTTVVFLVTARHDLSGLSRAFRQDFSSKNMRKGVFPEDKKDRRKYEQQTMAN